MRKTDQRHQVIYITQTTLEIEPEQGKQWLQGGLGRGEEEDLGASVGQGGRIMVSVDFPKGA